MSAARSEWFKSSYSAQNGECVEVRLSSEHLDIRDSKLDAGPALSFRSRTWRIFLTGLDTGRITTR